MLLTGTTLPRTAITTTPLRGDGLLAPSAVTLGLLAALTWGAADFAGGLATRRAATSRVVLIAHGSSLLLLAAYAAHAPVHLPLRAVLIAIFSGIAGGAGLMVFYQALALGAMGLSAALAGLLTAVLPVALGIRAQGLPAPTQLLGFGVAALAILLIAYAPAPVSAGKAQSRRALLLSALAGLGFGLQLTCLHSAALAGGSPRAAPTLAPLVSTLALSRVGGTSVALLAFLLRRKPSASTGKPVFLLALLAGLLDTSGNGFYMLSSLGGRLDVAAVLSSLYPGGTILLAALILRERATRLQALGMGLALAAVGLIAA